MLHDEATRAHPCDFILRARLLLTSQPHRLNLAQLLLLLRNAWAFLRISRALQYIFTVDGCDEDVEIVESFVKG